MSFARAFGLALFNVVCLVGETASPAHAQSYATEWSAGRAVELRGLPDATTNAANGINDNGQAVGSSAGSDFEYAVEWSNGRLVNLGGLPGYVDSVASSINNAGQVVGVSFPADGFSQATEWSGGDIINLGGLPGPFLAPPSTSTTPVRWWEQALSAWPNTPSSGAAAPSSIWAPCRTPRGPSPRPLTTPDRPSG
jgi:probable HAF family extracellular repeat protein